MIAAHSVTRMTWCIAMATRGDGHRPKTARMRQHDTIDAARRRNRAHDSESIKRRLAVIMGLLILIAGGMVAAIVLLALRR